MIERKLNGLGETKIPEMVSIINMIAESADRLQKQVDSIELKLAGLYIGELKSNDPDIIKDSIFTTDIPRSIECHINRIINSIDRMESLKNKLEI